MVNHVCTITDRERDWECEQFGEEQDASQRAARNEIARRARNSFSVRAGLTKTGTPPIRFGIRKTSIKTKWGWER